MSLIVTPRAVQVWRWHRQVCQSNGIPQMTLKHRSLVGSVTASGLNYHYEQPDPSTTLQTTTDYTIWVFWEPVQLRSGQEEGGDDAAGRAWIARGKGQCPIFDNTQNRTVIAIADEDWLVALDGTLFKTENPVISPDGTFWSFMMMSQR